jgi:hypothetical protein
MATFVERRGALSTALANTQTLFDQYNQQKTNQATLTAQRATLEANVAELSTRLNELESSADAYDREFLDRTRSDSPDGLRTPSFFARKGLSTFQDWLLAGFFGVYALLSILLTVYVGIASTKKVKAVSMVAGTSFVLGVMIAAVIRRFA